MATSLLIVAISAGTAAGTVSLLKTSSISRNLSTTQVSTARSPEYDNTYGFRNTSLTADQGVKSMGNAPDLTPAAERAVQAVVHIKVQGEREVRGGYIDPLEFFFGGRESSRMPQKQEVVGFGSGVIISDDGYIITNSHVVADSKNINVTLNDNRSFKAKLIGTDPSTDIALIKIEGKNFPTLPFGDADKLRLGEWVLAVGNPFNLTSTVTSGIVSAKSRATAERDPKGGLKVESYIQTDAAVNRGNSGGALVNAAGELVGINSMIFSETGNFTGYSFAVPINIAAKVVADIKNYGSVQRAMLGITGGDVTNELVTSKKLSVNSGFYVADFSEISAAVAAGIEKGDVITAINKNPIRNFGELQGYTNRFRPGDVIQVTVNRKGKELTLPVKLKNQDGGASISKSSGLGILGGTFKALERNQMRSYGISYGLEVSKLNSGKLKAAGIKDGFVILSANDYPLRSVSDLENIIRKIMSAPKDNRGLFLKGFYPDGQIRYYAIDLGQ